MSFFADIKIGYFEDYLNLIKTTTESDLKKLDKRSQEIKDSGAKSFTDETGQHRDPFDELSDEYFHLGEMEQLMYRTYVIGVFIFLEDEINSICQSIHNRTDKLIFSYKDLSGNGVSRSIKYLQIVTGKMFPADPKTSEDFEIAKIIRNSLVHQDGYIEEKYSKKIKVHITKNPDILKLTQLNEIEITHDYAESLIGLSKKINSELSIYDKSPW